MALRKKSIDNKANNPFVIPTDDAELITFLEKKRKDGKARMQERQLKMNLAFVLGEQWLAWDQNRRQFVRPTVKPNDPNAPIRVTVNKVGSLVEDYIARLLKNNLEPEVRPVSDEDDDISSARVGTRILDSEMNRLQWDSSLLDLYFWVLPFGWSYYQIAWDANDGDAIGADQNGESIYNGNISIDVVPGPELSVDPNSRHRDLRDARWAVRTITMTPEAIWETWGIVLQPGGTEGQRSLADEVYDLVDHDNTTTRLKDTNQVHQFWLRPGSRAKPDGMVVTWSGNTILEAPKPFPYSHGRLPFVEFDLLPGLGTREGRTFVKDMVPIQADYNDSRSREAGIRRTLTPKILAPAGSMDAQRMSSRVEVIQYNPTGAPPRLEMPDGRWMTQYETSMNRADAEMSTRTGKTDVNYGTRTPAASILAVNEMDETKMSVATRLMAEGIQLAGWMILELVRQFWAEERVVSTWTQDGAIDVARFQGSDIAHQVDVRVSVESALTKSKAARVQLALELMQMPSIAPSIDIRTFFQMIDLPGTDFVVASLNLDVKQAQRENNTMYEGQPVEVHTFDNHPAHIKEHDDFRKTEDYEKLGPDQRAIFDAHVDTHHSVMMTQMIAQQAAAAGILPGAPPPAGGDQGGSAQPGTPAPGGERGGPAYLAGNKPPKSPNALDQRVAQRAGIGATGQPGRVHGASADAQAHSMGQ